MGDFPTGISLCRCLNCSGQPSASMFFDTWLENLHGRCKTDAEANGLLPCSRSTEERVAAHTNLGVPVPYARLRRPYTPTAKVRG